MGNKENIWVECLLRGGVPPLKKLSVLPLRLTLLHIFTRIWRQHWKKVILSPWAFREYDLTKKTIIKTKTVKMTFREYLQRVNLETLTFYRDKDIWNTLQCFLNTFVIFLIRPIIQIYMRCTVAESIFKKSTSKL